MVTVQMIPSHPSGYNQHSLIFDIEESGQLHPDIADNHTNQAISQVRDLARATNAYERQLEADVSYFKATMAAEGEVDIVDLACLLASVGHDVRVRSALGGGTSNYFRNLSHEFLLVKNAQECPGVELVVECNFQEHFRIPCATIAYDALLRSVPEVFVGTLTRMAPLVESLVREMCKCFALQQVTVPPWRSARSIMSKWAPQKAEDWSPDASPRPSRGNSPRLRSAIDSPGLSPARLYAGAMSIPGALPDQTLPVPMALGGEAGKLPKGVSEGHSVHIGFGQGKTVVGWASTSPHSTPLMRIG